MTGDLQRFGKEEINSELRVRRDILKFIYENNFKDQVLQRALTIYFNGFLLLWYRLEINLIRKEISALKSIFKTKSSIFLWEWKLYIFYFKTRLKVPSTKLNRHLSLFFKSVKND